MRLLSTTFALAGGDDQILAYLLDGFAGRAAPQHGVDHVVGSDGATADVFALAGRGVQPLQRRLANRFPLGLGHGGEEREQHPAGPGRIIDPGERPGEHLQDQAVRDGTGIGGGYGAFARPGTPTMLRIFSQTFLRTPLFEDLSENRL